MVNKRSGGGVKDKSFKHRFLDFGQRKDLGEISKFFVKTIFRLIAASKELRVF